MKTAEEEERGETDLHKVPGDSESVCGCVVSGIAELPCRLSGIYTPMNAFPVEPAARQQWTLARWQVKRALISHETYWVGGLRESAGLV